VTLLLVAGQLWREIPSTGDWYTVAEVGPGLYAYRYSDDPSQAAHSPAHSGAGGLAGSSEAQPEEPEALESALGCVGRARA